MHENNRSLLTKVGLIGAAVIGTAALVGKIFTKSKKSSKDEQDWRESICDNIRENCLFLCGVAISMWKSMDEKVYAERIEHYVSGINFVVRFRKALKEDLIDDEDTNELLLIDKKVAGLAEQYRSSGFQHIDYETGVDYPLWMKALEQLEETLNNIEEFVNDFSEMLASNDIKFEFTMTDALITESRETLAELRASHKTPTIDILTTVYCLIDSVKQTHDQMKEACDILASVIDMTAEAEEEED